MTTSTPKSGQDVIGQWVTAFNAHDAVGVAALYAEDAQVTHPAYLQPLRGRKPVQDDTQACITALPNVTSELIRVVVGEDCAAAEMVIAGVHAGPLVTAAGTLPPTGRRLRFPVASFCRFGAGGRLVADHRYYDTAAILRQVH